MEQKVIDAKAIMEKLVEIEKDVSYIKDHMAGSDSLKEEMVSWEDASDKDLINWEKSNLKNE